MAYSTLLPSTVSSEVRLSPSRVTSAVVPSWEKTAWLGPDFASPSWILPAAVSVLPLMVKTETVPSLRFATSARVAVRLIDTPAAPAPACSVASTFGGEDFRSITESLSSGTVLVASAGSTFIAPVTSAKEPSGATATLGGGPTTLAGAGTSARTLSVPSVKSMTLTVSGRGCLRTTALPFSSTILPSLAVTRISAWTAKLAKPATALATTVDATRRRRMRRAAFMFPPQDCFCSTKLNATRAISQQSAARFFWFARGINAYDVGARMRRSSVPAKRL